jgi:heat shock protein HslJ
MNGRMLRRALTIPALLGVALLMVAGCGSSTSSGSAAEPASPPVELGGTTWNLSAYTVDGADVPAVTSPALASLTFGTDGSWHGSTGCNSLAGTFVQDGSALTMSSGPMTMMACDGPVADQEKAVLAALPQVASFASSSSLTLLAADDTVLLTYAPGLTELAGTSWTATGINNGKEAVVSAAGTEKATATFGADGQVSGSGGCNTFAGTFTTTEPDGLAFGPLAVTAMACSDDAVTQIEQEYFAALGKVTTYQLEGNSLTLRDATGATQVTYRQAT